MRLFSALVFCLCALCGVCRAADVNLATLTCAKYQNDNLSPPPGQPADPINTMMWMFGFSVARSGAHVMYGDALAAFGFSLDAQCKNNPNQSLMDALAEVKIDSKNPMDLNSLECATFAGRHVELKRTDPESAATIMMWLYGFAVAKSGAHVLNIGVAGNFETALLADCAESPHRSLFDTLSSIKY